MMINKSCYKIVDWFSYIFNTFFWNSIKFPRLNPSSATKIFNVFLAGINTKSVWNIPKEKYSAPLRILDLNELSKNFKAISTKELTSDKDLMNNLYQMLILLLILL